MKETLVIYHKNCVDGFAAAYCAWKEFGNDADYVALGYDERDRFIRETNLHGRQVYILDFSFSKVHTKSIILQAEFTTWLDHHKTAFEEWLGNDRDFYRSETAHELIILDKSRSGAMITYQTLIGIPVPDAIKYIDDRDRWIFNHPESQFFSLAVSQIPRAFENWNILDIFNNTTAESLVMVGGTIKEYYDIQIKRSIEQTKETCVLCGIEGLCCNLPPMFASDAGHILATESGTFGATWYRDKEGKIRWSLRSNGDFDVSEIAKQFGGGGHKNAAGFTTSTLSKLV